MIEFNSVLREGLKRILSDDGHDVLLAVESVEALREAGDIPEKVMVVLGSRGPADLKERIAQIKALSGAAVIVILGGQDEFQSTFEAIQAGAHAYLDDSTSYGAFCKTLELVAHNRAVFSLSDTKMPSECSMGAAGSGAPTLAGKPEQAVGRKADSFLPSLSPRETAILNLLQDGAPNKVIAYRLCLTESTVKVHLKAILRKIRVKNRTQAAIWALENPRIANGHCTES